MRVTPYLILLASFVVVVAAVAGCAMPDAGSESQDAAMPLPAGDIEDGRRAFLSHGCALCHAATGETAFPAPATAAGGPEIGGAQDDWTPIGIARAIIDPSHEVLPEFRDKRLNEDGSPMSPMAEYADMLTVQELADLVAYVRYLGE